MRILLLGSHMNYNLEQYVHMNLVKLGHEVRFKTINTTEKNSAS
jgi:hypothetical protein